MSTTSPEEEAGREILRLVEDQVALGPRVPGSAPHDALLKRLEDSLRCHTREVMLQEFKVPFRGRSIPCANVIGTFRASSGDSRKGPILLGTHFDTRPRADREPDPLRRECPIPGANDGGSGTAVLLHALPWLSRLSLCRDIIVAFFDAEDLGNIEGTGLLRRRRALRSSPSRGSAARGGDRPGHGWRGGDDLRYRRAHHHPCGEQAPDLGDLPPGNRARVGAICRNKPQRLKYVIADHHPFARRGIASCLLIDLDYPQWHMQDDTPKAVSAVSLGISEAALSLYLSQLRS